MTPPPATAESEESAVAEILLEETDGVLDLTDRRRVLLQVVFGVDMSPTDTDEVFTPSSPEESATVEPTITPA